MDLVSPARGKWKRQDAGECKGSLSMPDSLRGLILWLEQNQDTGSICYMWWGLSGQPTWGNHQPSCSLTHNSVDLLRGLCSMLRASPSLSLKSLHVPLAYLMHWWEDSDSIPSHMDPVEHLHYTLEKISLNYSCQILPVRRPTSYAAWGILGISAQQSICSSCSL